MKVTTTTILPAVLALLAAAPALVNAHGYPQTITISGKQYPGWLPFDSPYNGAQSIVRKISGDGPVTDVSSPAIACGTGTESGTGSGVLTAKANAGDQVTVTMNRWPDDHKGPLTFYMANCDGDCAKFDAAKSKSWFKIKEESLQNGQWPTDKLIANKLSDTVAIPSSLKSGNYLLRFEILALHDAGAPQYYPYCAQLQVTGGGNAVPAASDLTSFPGAYNSKQVAFTGDIWNDPKTWKIDGPPVVSLGGIGDGKAGAGGNSEPVVSSTSPSAPSPSDSSALANAGQQQSATTSPSPSLVQSPSPASTDSAPKGGKCIKRKRSLSSALDKRTKRALRSTIEERRAIQMEAMEMYERALKVARSSLAPR